MSGRLQAAKREVIRASENLAITECLVAEPWDEETGLDWTPKGGVEAAHDLLDEALARYVEAFNQEPASDVAGLYARLNKQMPSGGWGRHRAIDLTTWVDPGPDLF